MRTVLFIFIGAGVGGVARYAIGGWVQHATDSSFPFGTMAVNLIGCLAVGFLSVSLEATLVREEHRLAILIGLLGGFTTFSTFSRETMALVNERQWMMAGGNVLLTNFLCLVGAWLGMRLAERVYGV